MLSKLSTTQQILIMVGVLLIGLVIGNIIPPVSQWFKPSAPAVPTIQQNNEGNTSGQKIGRTCKDICNDKYAYSKKYWTDLYNQGKITQAQLNQQIQIASRELEMCISKCK